MNASMTKNKWNQFKSDFLLHFEHQITINAVSAIHSVNHTQVINFDTIEYMKWITRVTSHFEDVSFILSIFQIKKLF